MNIFDVIKNAVPQSAADLFVRSTDIASYMPGRVRLYSKQLVNNAALENVRRDRACGYEYRDGLDSHHL